MSLQGVGGCSPAHQAAKLSAQASLHREALAWVQDLGLTAPRAAGGAIWADLTLL